MFETSPMRQVAAYLHESKDHGGLTGSDLLLSLPQLDEQHLPPFLQQGSYTADTEG